MEEVREVGHENGSNRGEEQVILPSRHGSQPDDLAPMLFEAHTSSDQTERGGATAATASFPTEEANEVDKADWRLRLSVLCVRGILRAHTCVLMHVHTCASVPMPVRLCMCTYA